MFPTGTSELGYWLGGARGAVPPSCRDRFPQRSWYQGSPPPPGDQGGWKSPRNSGGCGGRQPPSKNNLMGPGCDIFVTRIRILGPGSNMLGSKNMKFGLKWVHMVRMAAFSGSRLSLQPPESAATRTGLNLKNQPQPGAKTILYVLNMVRVRRSEKVIPGSS